MATLGGEYLRQQEHAGPIFGLTAAVVGDEFELLESCGANAVLPKPLEIFDLKLELARHESEARQNFHAEAAAG